jgi:SAM-dependent methyltransferase
MTSHSEKEHIRSTVREGYARIAEGNAQSCCGASSCCSADPSADATQLAQQIGYSLEELQTLPEGANLGLSCGNPVALAALRPGEVVLDLGSGAGFDAFIAGPRVGREGRVIGVDMTPEMLAKARRNAEGYRQSTGLDNVEFRLGEIEHLPLADNSVDVIISNCVINLSPDKAQVWREMARALKPGGRVAVSDIALLQPLPSDVAQMAESLVGCVAGAALVGDIERMAREAGFVDVVLEEKPGYVDSMSTWNDPLYLKIKDALPANASLGQYITSVNVDARLAKKCCCSG